MVGHRRLILKALGVTGAGVASTYAYKTGDYRFEGVYRGYFFMSRVLPLVYQYGTLVYNRESMPLSEFDKKLNTLHDRAAPVALDVILNLRGFYVKVGQFASGRGDMTPPAYVKYLRRLQDEVPHENAAYVMSQLHRYGVPVHRFITLEEQPLGAASIGQVHKAWLRLPPDDSADIPAEVFEQAIYPALMTDAALTAARVPDAVRAAAAADPTVPVAPVVVKIQYPNVQAAFHVDIQCLRFLAWAVNPSVLPVLDELEGQFFTEFAYDKEAENLRKCRHNLLTNPLHAPHRSRIVMPVPITSFCRKRALVMTYIPGAKAEVALNDGRPPGAHMDVWSSIQTAAASRDESSRDASPESLKASKEAAARVEAMFRRRSAFATAVDATQAAVFSLAHRIGGDRALAVVGSVALWTFFAAHTVLDKGYNVAARAENAARGVWLLFLRFCAATKLVEPSVVSAAAAAWEPKKLRGIHMTGGLTARTVMRLLLDVHGVQILSDGLFNGDVHPGNLLITPTGKVGLIDYGQVKAVSSAARAELAELFIGVAHDNLPQAAQALRRLGVTSLKDSEWYLGKGAQLTFGRYDGRMTDGMRLRDFLDKFMTADVVDKAPGDIYLCARTALLLRGLGFLLGLNVGPAEAWAPIAQTVLVSEFPDRAKALGLM